MHANLSYLMIFLFLFNFSGKGYERIIEATIEVETTPARIKEDQNELVKVKDQLNLSEIKNKIAKKFPTVDRKIISKMYLKTRADESKITKDGNIVKDEVHLYLVIYMPAAGNKEGAKILDFAKSLISDQITNFRIISN